VALVLFDAAGAELGLGGFGGCLGGGLGVLVLVLDLAATTGRPLIQGIWSADMVVKGLIDCCVRKG
jgi:hypothetical protein